MAKTFRRIISIVLALVTIFSICTCASAQNLISSVMGDRNILSYKYSEEDDYWYTDKDNSWQHNFGYSALYDIVAPFALMEYDYTRVHFEYEGKDWMVQLWKGQYGEVFYGCEAGVYTKPHSDKQDTLLTFYDCAAEDDRLQMQTSLYHYDEHNVETRVFSTPDEKTWWSTGFKFGHLRCVEPANELKQTGTIVFDDEEMAKAFAEGLKECGFAQSLTKYLAEDSFYIDGTRVDYSWRNLSQAENTMPIKTFTAAVAASSVFLFGVMVFESLKLFVLSLVA